MTTDTERAELLHRLRNAEGDAFCKHARNMALIKEAADYIESNPPVDGAANLPDDLDTATLVLRSKLMDHAIYLSPHTCRQIAAAINAPSPVDAAVERGADAVRRVAKAIIATYSDLPEAQAWKQLGSNERKFADKVARNAIAALTAQHKERS